MAPRLIATPAIASIATMPAAQQTKIRHTSPEKIKDCTVWVPDFDVQKNIGRILTDIDNKIAINRQINDNLPLLDRSSAMAKVRHAA